MNEGQRKLVEAYEQVAEFLPETPITVWRAWRKLGKRSYGIYRLFKYAKPL